MTIRPNCGHQKRGCLWEHSKVTIRVLWDAIYQRTANGLLLVLTTGLLSYGPLYELYDLTNKVNDEKKKKSKK